MKTHTLGIIPVRLLSARLEQKALIEIQGKPLIVHTYLNAKLLKKKGLLDDLFVATDSEEVAEAIKKADIESKIIFTPVDCRNGVDRIVCALKKIPAQSTQGEQIKEIVVNIQGDEPLFSPENMQKLVSFFLDFPSSGTNEKKNAKDMREPDISTLAIPIAEEKAINPNIVKVVLTKEGRALYFSRALIPYNRDNDGIADHVYFRHLGVYAYKRSFLEKKLPFLPHTDIEEIEKIEQLRFLSAGCDVLVGIVETAGIDVNTQEDIENFSQFLQKKV